MTGTRAPPQNRKAVITRMPAMGGWTRFVIDHRRRIIAVWLALLVVGGFGAANLSGLLTNRFSVPGSDAERGRQLLRDRMGERPDGAFTLVAQGRGGAPDPAVVLAAAQRAAARLPGGRTGFVQRAGHGVVFVQITTLLDAQDAEKL